MPAPTPVPTASDIRQQFIDFFVRKHGHANVPSSPVVPHNDPTLLFANAGMNQFKPYFLGTETPEHTRVTNTQKCIRAGGKHNDLDDVGRDTYHHTFFEMLGNWSFGDYFKAEAIDWAWELLTGVWGIDAERLHATYFEGDASEGLEPDLEAKAMWEKYLPAERVHPGNKKDNFWEMGDTGPCGPCSELHYDRSPGKDQGAMVNADDQDTVVEIWNLVFIQFNRGTDGKLSPLPDKHVDTGMGFERIVRILQGKDSNYDTDVFTPLFESLRNVTGARAYAGGPESLSDPIDTAYRVIADHIRTLTFALSDGAHCGNTGRDSVLRTVLRRAVRYGHQTLGVGEPFFYKLVPAVVEAMGDAFPEITRSVDAVQAELREEEIDFRRTLERGIVLFDRAVDGLASGATMPGDAAFDLEATYGFPISLTQVMALERGLTVDMEGYAKAKAQHAEISRGDGKGVDLGALLVELTQKHDLPDSDFLGYDTTEFAGETPVFVFPLGGVTAIVTGATPFYGEAGGQVGDTGTLTLDGRDYPVTDTQKVGGVVFHLTPQDSVGPPSTEGGSMPVTLRVDVDRRAKIASNHTSTHLLNRALRDHVNDDAMQKGSLVDDTKLRFDFAHGKTMSADELEVVERQVNEDIAADLPVHAQVAAQEEALKINGLRAVFGEKYPPRVRVVSVGPSVDELLADPDNLAWAEKSIEFCGGTHLRRTGEAGRFVLASQEAVSKGVRRVTCLTGDAARAAVEAGDALLARLDALGDAPPDRLASAIEEANAALADTELPLLTKQAAQARVADLLQRVKAHQKAAGKKLAGAAIEHARGIADAHDGDAGSVVVAVVPGCDGAALQKAAEVVTKRHPDAAVLLVGTTDDKVAVLALVPKAVQAVGLKAGDWVKHVAPIVGGGGGGKPDRAQAGGKDPSKADDAVAAARAFAEAALS